MNIMRCFAGVFFWLFAQVAFAVHCQTDDRVWRDMRAETLIIYTDVKLDAENSRVTMKSAVPTVCRHNFPVTFPLSYREWIASTSDTFNQAPKFSAFSSGMIVGGNEYPWPLGPGRYLAEGSRSGPNYFFWLGMYLKLSSSPGLNIKIDAGDVIGNFHFSSCIISPMLRMRHFRCTFKSGRATVWTQHHLFQRSVLSMITGPLMLILVLWIPRPSE